MRFRQFWAALAATVMVAAGLTVAAVTPASAATFLIGDSSSCQSPLMGVNGTWVPQAPPQVGRCTSTVSVTNASGNIWVVPDGVTLILNGPLTTNLGVIEVQAGGTLAIWNLSNSGTISVKTGGQLYLSTGTNQAAGTIELEANSGLELSDGFQTFTNIGLIEHCGAELVYGEVDGTTFGTLAGNQPVENCDSDGDGVPDGIDLCPGGDDTADADGDGIPNDCDPCPLEAGNGCITPPDPCAAGSYSTTGDEPCTPAPAGYFVPGTGATSATACPAGSYSSSAGSTACTPATPGFYVPNEGSATQTPCPEGTTSSAGATVCTATPPPGYTFGGFAPPVAGGDAVNQRKAGAAVPVKFSLGGDQGLDIFAAGSPSSQQVDCQTSAPLGDAATTLTAGSSSLSYDPATGLYSYVWKTTKGWAGTCRDLTLTFDEGSTQVAHFRFK